MSDATQDTAAEATAPPSTEPAAPPAVGQDPVLAKVVEALKNVYDPEIPVNIYELGLIYGLDITPEGAVLVRMTLTTPSCPVAGSLPGEVEAKVRRVPGVTSAKVDVVWDPPWDKGRMSEAAKLQLGIDDDW